MFDFIKPWIFSGQAQASQYFAVLSLTASIGALPCNAGEKSTPLQREGPQPDPRFSAYAADTMVKVGPTGSAPHSTALDARIELAKNEYEGFQIVLVAGGDPVENLAVRVSDLVGPNSATIRASTDIRRYRVGFLRPSRKNDSSSAVERPDPLIPLPGCPDFAPIADSLFEPEEKNLGTIAPNSSAPFWFTVHAPANALPGEYHGTVDFVSPRGTLTVPVTVQVWDFQIPQKWSLRSEMWFDDGVGFYRYYGGYPTLAEYSRAVEFLDTYRVTSGLSWLRDSQLVQVTRELDGDYSFDFSKLDPWIERCLKRGNWFNVNLGCGAAWDAHFSGVFGRQTPIFDKRTGKTFDFPGASPISETDFIDTKLFSAFWRSYGRHIKEKGWIDRCYLENVDEPPYGSASRDKPRNALLRKFSTAIRELVPGLPLMNYGVNPSPKYHSWAESYIDIWGPALNSLTEIDDVLRAQTSKGKPFVSYICGGSVRVENKHVPDVYIANSAMDLRIMPWMIYRYSGTGVLYYAGNRWIGDNDRERFPTEAEHRWPAREWRFGRSSGLGWFTYPAPRIKAVFPSIRLENIRDGLEDYEYLVLLQNLKNKHIPVTPLVTTVLDWQNDPEALRRMRKAMATEIVERQKRP